MVWGLAIAKKIGKNFPLIENGDFGEWQERAAKKVDLKVNSISKKKQPDFVIKRIRLF